MIFLAYTEKIQYNTTVYKTCYYPNYTCGDWGKYSDIEIYTSYTELGLVFCHNTDLPLHADFEFWSIANNDD